MALEFRSVTIQFDKTSGQPHRKSTKVAFSGRVHRANAALKGFNIGYANGEHHLLQQEIDIDVTTIDDDTVEVAVDFLLRDGSGNIDDPYRGSVEVLVLAEVA